MKKEELKVCKICNKLKTLSEFTFHKTTGYYHRTCINCSNQKRRNSYLLSTGRRENSKFIREKVCIKCNVKKDATVENFYKGGNKLQNVCKKCKDDQNLKKTKAALNLGYLPEDTSKKCTLCKQVKNIKHFSFSKKIGYYSSYCKPCDVKRKQSERIQLTNEEKSKRLQKQREYYHSNYESNVLTRYRVFDRNKNLKNNLTKSFINSELKKPCVYCKHPSSGLDRIDNSLGHIIENCVPCCKECNVARNNNFSHEEMKIIGLAIKKVKDAKKL